MKTHPINKFLYLASGILVGLSAIFLTQANYTVQTDIENAVQVIKKIILPDGSTETTLSGDTITTVHMNATEYCDESADNCVDIADVYTGTPIDSFLQYSGDYYETGTTNSMFDNYYDKTEIDNATGDIYTAIADATGNMQDYADQNDGDSFLQYSGDYYESGTIDTMIADATGNMQDYADNTFLTEELWSKDGKENNNIIYTGGQVKINNNLVVSGTIQYLSGQSETCSGPDDIGKTRMLFESGPPEGPTPSCAEGYEYTINTHSFQSCITNGHKGGTSTGEFTYGRETIYSGSQEGCIR